MQNELFSNTFQVNQSVAYKNVYSNALWAYTYFPSNSPIFLQKANNSQLIFCSLNI